MLSLYGNPELGEIPETLFDIPSSGYDTLDWGDD
jgi:hypothetical protein